VRGNGITTHLLAGALALAAAAAAARGEELTRVASSAHAVYYAGRPHDVDVRRSEAFLARLDSLFGPPPAGWRVQYYRHAGLAQVQAQVGFPASGVTDLATGRVDSVRPYHPHELVHAAMGRVGRPPALFAEGLAVALTSGGEWKGRPLDDWARGFLAARGQLRDVLLAFALDDPDRDYALAGSFVAFLLDRYGIDPMLVFLRACGGRGRYERAATAAYGRPFDALVVDWERALAAPASPRPWYDAATWPGSLRSQPSLPLPGPAVAADMAAGRLLAEPAVPAQVPRLPAR
jgi:hypothetical protein